MGILLCVAAFLAVFMAGRRSLVAGLSTVLGIGFFYGILRANFPDGASHFIFDAAAAALYATQLFRRQTATIARNSRPVLLWFTLLFAWPALMLFVPLQDALVQLVGLRGNMFLLPFLIFGARLRREEIARLAFSLAVLNLVVFAVTAVEYRIGIEPFFPRNANTEIIYRSADVGAEREYRIPSTFTGSHAYAGAMVMHAALSLRRVGHGRNHPAPPRAHVVRQRRRHPGRLRRRLARAHRGSRRCGARGLVLRKSRTPSPRALSRHLRRNRLSGSWPEGACSVSPRSMTPPPSPNASPKASTPLSGTSSCAIPFGNGLGGGGTSLPYFLEDRVRDRVTMENEYARILLEQGIIGLCLWVGFIVWFVTRRFSAARTSWQMGEHVAWAACIMYFGSAMIGTGLLTSIPQTALLLLLAGWVASRQPAQYEELEREAEQVEALA